MFPGISNFFEEISSVSHSFVFLYFFAAKDGEALYNQQKQDWELTLAQLMKSILPNLDLN